MRLAEYLVQENLLQECYCHQKETLFYYWCLFQVLEDKVGHIQCPHQAESVITMLRGEIIPMSALVGSIRQRDLTFAKLHSVREQIEDLLLSLEIGQKQPLQN